MIKMIKGIITLNIKKNNLISYNFIRQKQITKSIMEFLILEMQSFKIVENPGFQRINRDFRPKIQHTSFYIFQLNTDSIKI